MLVEHVDIEVYMSSLKDAVYYKIKSTSERCSRLRQLLYIHLLLIHTHTILPLSNYLSAKSKFHLNSKEENVGDVNKRTDDLPKRTEVLTSWDVKISSSKY